MDSITARATARATEKIEQQRILEMLETLISKNVAAAQQITVLTTAVRDLTMHQKIMDEELTKRISQMSISQPSATVSPQSAGDEKKLSEIASTLNEFAQNLDGQKLHAASQSLVAEAQKNHAATISAIENLKTLAEVNKGFVSRVGGVIQRMERRTEERVQNAVAQVAGEASATITANVDASNDRAERIIGVVTKLEARQLWSAAGALCLTLLAVAVVIAGVWMAIAGVITGAQWALDVDGSVWLGIGRWAVTAIGITAAGYGLFSSARWVTLAMTTRHERRPVDLFSRRKQ